MPLFPAAVYSGHKVNPLYVSRKVIYRMCTLYSKYVKVKGKGSSLDIAPLTILDGGALQPRKWQMTGIDYSTVAQASGCP